MYSRSYSSLLLQSRREWVEQNYSASPYAGMTGQNPHFGRNSQFLIDQTSTQPFQQKNDEPGLDWSTFTLRAQCLDLTRAQSNSLQSLFRSGPSRNTVIRVPPVSVLASYWPLIQH